MIKQSMRIDPVPENTASDQVRKCYSDIKMGLDSAVLPVFFTYLGAFPEYLIYISEQLVHNFQDPLFNKLVTALHSEVLTGIKHQLKKSEENINWIRLYQLIPSFYYFQNDLKTISLTNTKLACIFVALRETVKGWAIAAKKLTYKEKSFESLSEDLVTEDDFIFDKNILDKYKNIPLDKLAEKYFSPVENKKYLALKKIYLEKRGATSLEKNLLPEYIRNCHMDFRQLMKYDYFWSLRVALEEKVLLTLDNLPHLIYSPYNVIFNLTQKYDNFYELIYLLSEHFPTLTMQRLMFSGFMII